MRQLEVQTPRSSRLTSNVSHSDGEFFCVFVAHLVRKLQSGFLCFFSEWIANIVQHWKPVRLLGIAHANLTFASGHTADTFSESPEKWTNDGMSTIPTSRLRFSLNLDCKGLVPGLQSFDPKWNWKLTFRTVPQVLTVYPDLPHFQIADFWWANSPTADTCNSTEPYLIIFLP